MYNLIKMDIYRLLRGKSFFVMIAVTILCAVFSISMTNWSLDLMEESNDSHVDRQTVVSSQEPEFSFGIYVDTKTEWLDTVNFTDYINGDFSSRMLVILCVIFSSIFVNGEQKNGYIKNIAGQLPKRGFLVFSKLTAISLQVFFILVAYIITVGVVAMYIWKDKVLFGSFLDFIKVFGIHYLLHLSFSSVITTLTIWLKSSGFSMAFGILSSTGVTGLLYSFVNAVLYKCGVKEGFDIGSYTLEQSMIMVAKEPSPAELTKIMGVGMVFLIISVFVSMLLMQKRDIG